MPSSQTSVRAIERKIFELEDKADRNSGLSESNLQMLEFYKQWRELAGQDPILVIEPKGALVPPGAERPEARLVEVTDLVAADLLTHARQRNQRVRLARPEEREAYVAHVKAQQEAVRGQAAQQNALLAEANLRAMLGAAAQGGATPTPAPVPEPTVPFGAERDDTQPGAPVLPAVGAANDQAPAAEPRETEPAGPTLADLEAPELIDGLVAKGFDSVEKIAEADPGSLTDIHGIGKATAARLVVKASELLSAGDDEGEGTGD